MPAPVQLIPDGLTATPEWMICAERASITHGTSRHSYSAIRNVSRRRLGSTLSRIVTSRDGQGGLMVVALSLLRPRLAQPHWSQPDREVPDDHHNRCPRP